MQVLLLLVREETGKPLQADLGLVCDFLTEQFEVLNKSYGTINSYRSALSSMLLPVDAYALGEHPIIVR